MTDDAAHNNRALQSFDEIVDDDFLTRALARARSPEALARAHELEEREASARATRMREVLTQVGVPLKVRTDVLGPLSMRYTSMRVAEEFWKDAAQRILVLGGTKGVGKTVAATWLLTRHIEGYDIQPSPGLRRRWIYGSSIAELRTWDDGDLVDHLRTTGLLVIDDIGLMHADRNGFFLGKLHDLLIRRRDAELRTVMTGNIDEHTFRELYGAPVVDRVRESGTFYEINEPSIRKTC